MLPGLVPGLEYVLTYTVPREKTVPYLFPEAKHLVEMPEVLASGHMISLMEWCCIEALAPYLEDDEGTLGTGFEIFHEAATPPGMTVTVDCMLQRVDGRKLSFSVTARDDVEPIGRGTHDRVIVNRRKFMEKVAQKAG